MRTGTKLFLAIAATTVLAGPAAAQAVPSTGEFQLVAESVGMTAQTGSDFVRARAALASGDFRLARYLFVPLADGSMSSDVHLMAGYAELGAGQTVRAQRRFWRSLALDSGNVLARHGLGLAFLLTGQRDLARGELAKIEAFRNRCAATCREAPVIDQAARSLSRAIG